MKAFLAAGLATAILALTVHAQTPLADVPLTDIDGKPRSLSDYKGKVALLVNVASKCGNTPQYSGLESLYKKYQEQGFVVLGIPSNDFGGQEPGTNDEIKEFCSSQYAVSFPLFDKVHVKGPEQHPLYAKLTGPEAKFPGDVTWNFEKFLIGRNGEVLGRFTPKTEPLDPAVVSAVEAALQ